MTITTTNNRIAHVGDGVSTSFPFPFYFLANTDVKVYVAGVQLTSGYNVTGAGNANGGNVSFTSTPELNASIVLYRDPDTLQSSSLPANDPFPSRTVETMVDKAMMLIQRMKELVSRSVTLSDGDPNSTSLVVPVVRANKALIFDASGNLTVSADNYVDQAASVAANAAIAANAATAAATSQTSAGVSASNAALSKTAAELAASQALYYAQHGTGFAASTMYDLGSVSDPLTIFNTDLGGIP